MKTLHRNLLEQLILGCSEPILVAQTDRADWPVVLSNPAFASISRTDELAGQPLADVVEKLAGRELALEVSETIRAGQETSLAVSLFGRDYVLVLRPITMDSNTTSSYYVAYWRGGAGGAGADGDMHRELARARRRIRDLSRDDPVTGLLNRTAFRDVLAHDWAVAARERSSLALVSFKVEEFDAYLQVFGRHATDSCLRRVAQAIRRCLRRASDVAARVDDCTMMVLAHASSEAGVSEFAAKISSSVRELGIHHPRAKAARFVTVSHRICVTPADGNEKNAEAFLKSMLEE
jgi:diguanylate cyclase (GGDEF)-like protein